MASNTMQLRLDAASATAPQRTHVQHGRPAGSTRGFFSGPACVALAIAACLGVPGHAWAGTFNGEASLSSQLVDRGLAITPATPVMQGAVSWTNGSGWTLGLSAAVESRSPGNLAAGVASVTRAWSLSDNWRMQTGVNYYHYAYLRRGNVYEPGVYWIYRDVLTMGLSGTHVVGTAGRWLQPAADLNLRWPLANDLALSAGIGVARHAVYRGHHEQYYGTGYYRYGMLGLLWSHGPWRVELDRITVHFNTPHEPYGLLPSPWLATFSRSF
jgi:hypothetical protein